MRDWRKKYEPAQKENSQGTTEKILLNILLEIFFKDSQHSAIRSASAIPELLSSTPLISEHFLMLRNCMLDETF